MSERVVALLGPTASGKSALAHALALKTGGIILSCDSAQVYRHFDVGTAKPTKKERSEVPYFGLDLIEHDAAFDAGAYADYAQNIVTQHRDKLIFIVGGTGLYFRALTGAEWDDLPSDAKVRESFASLTPTELYAKLLQLDPERAAEVHPNDRFRVERALEVITLTGRKVSELYGRLEKKAPQRFRVVTIVLDPPRDILLKRIQQRTEQMLRQGLIDEVRRLKEQGISASAWPMQMIGYASVNNFLDGHLDEAELTGDIVQHTHRYAKRQRTWFSRLKADLVVAASENPSPEHLLNWLGIGH